tara:strand:- start:3277 stop:4455 length:1179 start_codon:yes stop_codon:yes gene_type:complete
MLDHIKPLLGKLCAFSQEKMGFSQPPKLFLRSDSDNSKKVLGKTAFYNPDEKSVTLFVTGRHPKDILRSFTHELVHHSQNLRGDLSLDKVGSMGKNYAQDNDHMRNMEKEAYLQGNMCFRDWEDTIEDKDKFLIKLAESKFLKENKTMTTKITKEFLKETIVNILKENIGAADKVAPGGMSDEDYYKYAQRNTVAKDTDRYRKIASDMKAKKKKTKPSAGEAFAQFAQDVGAIKEDDAGELEVGPGLPDTIEPDLEIKPTLDDLIKQKQEEMMGTVEDAIAELKAELEAMDLQVTQPSEPEIEEGAGCAKRNCVDESCPTHGKTIKEEDKDGDGHVVPDWADQDDNDPKVGPKNAKNESKIQTPEQENTLYEQRFAPKNNRLFEKLVKEWTK